MLFCCCCLGIGFAMLVVSFLCCVYYNVIIAWCLYYMYESFDSEVPWKYCGNSWNTDKCHRGRAPVFLRNATNSTLCTLASNASDPNCVEVKADVITPSKEFWERYVLRISENIDHFGKGIKSSGKVVYFTATFPYVVLVILLIRGVTLPGASKGLLFYLKPDFTKLGEAIVWVDAATQIFYSLGIGFGSLIAMGSYNKFHNNCYRYVCRMFVRKNMINNI